MSSGRASLLAAGGLAAGLVHAASTASGDAPSSQDPPRPNPVTPEPAPEADGEAEAVAEAKPPPILIGDSALRGRLALGGAKVEGERYVAPLEGGGSAVLTLDPEIQQAAFDTLEHARAPLGAIVVMGVDGRLLAYAGRRNEEPVRERAWKLPAQTWAPAASVFKVVTTSALVSQGVEPTRRVCYHGGFRSVERDHLRDHPRDSRCEDLEFALAKSQNAIIAKLAHRHLDRATLRTFARGYGFGRAPEFAIAAEPAVSEIPDEDLEFARVAAGFWHTRLSAVGGALLANTVASGGLSVTPRIVERVVTEGGDERTVVGVAPVRVLDEHIARAVGEMMVGTTEIGTARRAFRDPRGRKFFDAQVAGKTGSLARDEPSYLGYSWFVGFAPADDPQVAIAVLLGNPPKWYLKAHTAARLVLQEVF